MGWRYRRVCCCDIYTVCGTHAWRKSCSGRGAIFGGGGVFPGSGLIHRFETRDDIISSPATKRSPDPRPISCEYCQVFSTNCQRDSSACSKSSAPSSSSSAHPSSHLPKLHSRSSSPPFPPSSLSIINSHTPGPSRPRAQSRTFSSLSLNGSLGIGMRSYASDHGKKELYSDEAGSTGAGVSRLIFFLLSPTFFRLLSLGRARFLSEGRLAGIGLRRS